MPAPVSTRIAAPDDRCTPSCFSIATMRWRRHGHSTSAACRATRSGRCMAFRSGSRTSSTPPIIRPNSARRSPPAAGPGHDATVVAKLRAAGAVIIGKTVTTEFAYFHPGPTRNPHDHAAHARRLVVRIGRGGRRPHGAARARHADQRVGDPSGRLLRRLRRQADPRAGVACRRAAALAQARPCRGVRAFASGSRAHP